MQTVREDPRMPTRRQTLAKNPELLDEQHRRNYFRWYHSALNMPDHHFESLRETASQNLGNEPSPMWGTVLNKNVPKLGPMNDLEKIARAHHKSVLAKYIEAEHASGGGTFGPTYHNVWSKNRMWINNQLRNQGDL